MQTNIWRDILVSGLGLLGILTGQILVAQGCKVIGIDPDAEKCKLANKFGIETHNLINDNSALSFIDNFTKCIGVDGAIITASTSSSDPIHLAAKSCRKQGRIISIGVTGMEIRRDLFYEKELSFQVSCSYGLGDMTRIMKKKEMIILCAMLDGLKKEILKQF